MTPHLRRDVALPPFGKVGAQNRLRSYCVTSSTVKVLVA